MTVLSEQRILSAYHTDEDHDDRDHEQEMDEAPQCIRTHKAEEPEYKENRGYGVQHKKIVTIKAALPS